MKTRITEWMHVPSASVVSAEDAPVLLDQSERCRAGLLVVEDIDEAAGREDLLLEVGQCYGIRSIIRLRCCSSVTAASHSQ